MPVVRIPLSMSARTGGQVALEVDGGTVREALQDACRRYPELNILFADDGALRSGFLVGLNLNEDLASLPDPVGPGDTIVVVAAVAGGRQAT